MHLLLHFLLPSLFVYRKTFFFNYASSASSPTTSSEEVTTPASGKHDAGSGKAQDADEDGSGGSGGFGSGEDPLPRFLAILIFFFFCLNYFLLLIINKPVNPSGWAPFPSAFSFSFTFFFFFGEFPSLLVNHVRFHWTEDYACWVIAERLEKIYNQADIFFFSDVQLQAEILLV